MALNLFIAFVAGLLSFFSPCVFTIVPAFLAYLAGMGIRELDGKGFSKEIFLNTLAYVIGFSLVFALLGLAITTILRGASLEVRDWLRRIGGIIVVVFGLFLIGIIRIPWLEREHKLHVARKAGYTTSFLFGVAFAVGWTPCIGAVLGGIFTLALSQPGSAFPLLLAYSIGLSLPFLAVGLFYSSAAKFIRLSAKYTRIISIILGVILVMIGVLMFFNDLLLVQANPLFVNWI